MMKKTHTFHFDGAEFKVMADDLGEAFMEANAMVRDHGVTDNFAWFDHPSEPDTYILRHNVAWD